MSELSAINDQSFETEVMDSDRPVLVDFWADWCHPCHLITPEVEALSRDHSAQVKVVKLNVDDSPVTAGRFGVMSIPTLLLFVDGMEKARIVGVRRKDDILREIESFLPEVKAS